MARPRKPTALRLVEGNRGKRAVNAKEPEPLLLDDLTPPPHLPSATAAVWTELAPKFRRAMVLTELDTPLFEMTCHAIAMHRLTMQKTDGGKVMARNEETGSVSLSPWTMLQSMSFKQGVAGLLQFGASPAARSKVMIEPQGDLFDNPTGAGRFFK